MIIYSDLSEIWGYMLFAKKMNLHSLRRKLVIFTLVLFSSPLQAALPDIKFGQYQVADAQWDTTACLTTSTCLVNSKVPGTAYKTPFDGSQIIWAPGDYIQLILSGDNSYPYRAQHYDSNGVLKDTMGLGKIVNITPSYFFFVGGDNATGTLFSGANGMDTTDGIGWNNLLNPSIAVVDAYSNFYSVEPLASGETAAVDASDAPVSYGNARHVVTPGTQLGADTTDDGVVMPVLIPGQTATIKIIVSGQGYLQAWVDWNGDGDFNDIGEQIATDVEDGGVDDRSAESGVIELDILVPATATTGSTFARFRWSILSGLASVGSAPNGEIEDYQIASSGVTQTCEMKDLAPGLYSTASVSTNTHELTNETRVYQATFNSANWEGQVTAYSLNTHQDDGNLKSEVWNTNKTINRSTRKLFSYNPSLAGSNRGSTFQWESLSKKQKRAFRAGGDQVTGEAIVDWVKGHKDKETAKNIKIPLRERKNVLGGIINSNLNLRGRLTNFGYKQLSGKEGASYAGYLLSKQQTKDTLFVGANDGMLHAFDAENGTELFAYIPNQVIPKFAALSHPKYGCSFTDCLSPQYLVDGKSTAADAYFNNRWHTVLVGTLGLGGKGIYALDVSMPSSFSPDDVLWEISDTQASDNASIFSKHMGVSLPEPVIIRMKNDRWAAVVGNGYESSQHQAVLFIIDIATGKLIKTINTEYGSSDYKNGLSSPVAVDSDGDYIADTIYAGDLQGNVWAFDVSSESIEDWGSKYGTAPLFRACVNQGCTQHQKITAKPQVGRNPSGGLMVYVGTGKYMGLRDNVNDSKQVAIDTFYGLHDNGQVINFEDLVQQRVLKEVRVATNLKSRVTTNNLVEYPLKSGWYMHLLSPPEKKAEGERVVSQALLREGRLIFVTLSPPQNRCDWKGGSWLMELNALDGSRLSTIPIDINGDNRFTTADNVNDGSTIISGVQRPSLGMVFGPPAIITHNTRMEGKYLTGSEGSVEMFKESSSRFTGRMSWKKLR